MVATASWGPSDGLTCAFEHVGSGITGELVTCGVWGSVTGTACHLLTFFDAGMFALEHSRINALFRHAFDFLGRQAHSLSMDCGQETGV